MPDFRQRVINLLQNCTNKIAPYAISLAVASNKRTYAGISDTLCVSYRLVRDRAPKKPEDFFSVEDSLIEKVRKYQTEANPGWLICDFTRLAKSKDAKTEQTTKDRDGRSNAVNNGYSVGFSLWTNGLITIPVSFFFWLNKEKAADKYVSKKECVRNAIIAISKKLTIREVLVDGEFSSQEMLNFFADHNIGITARIQRNRVVESDDGVIAQLQLHQGLRLLRNAHSRTIRAKLRGRYYWLTAVKHTTRGGKKKIVYIISTEKREQKEHVATYKKRWNCEKFFRTAKQALGLEDCQAKKVDGIKGHIWSVMILYSSLEETRYFKKKKSPEFILNILKSKTNSPIVLQYIDLVETYATC